MRVVRRWWVALVVILLARVQVQAQAPSRTALVGTWVRTAPWTDSTGKERLEVDTLVLHADSTWELYTIDSRTAAGFQSALREEPAPRGGPPVCVRLLWFLAGDSFWFDRPAAAITVHGHTVVVGALPVKVSLRGQELTMEVPNPRDKSPKVYTRIGDARPRKCR